MGSNFSEVLTLCAEYDSKFVNPSTTKPENFSAGAITIIGEGSAIVATPGTLSVGIEDFWASGAVGGITTMRPFFPSLMSENILDLL